MKRVIAIVALVASWAIVYWPGLAAAQDGGDDGGTDEVLPADDGSVDETPAEEAPAEEAPMEEPMAGDAMGEAAMSSPRLVLPKDQIFVQAFLEINLSKGQAFKPLALQPDVWYGVTDDITVGLVHSPRALSGFVAPAAPGGGLCLGSSENCGNRYSGVGLLGRYHLLDDPVILAADGGLVFGDFDPFSLAIKLGVVGEKKFDKISVLFGASLSLGLTNRDNGNKEVLSLPVGAMYEVMPKLSAGVQTGIRLPFSNAGDLYSIPLALAGRYIVTPKIIVDASFSLPLLITGIPDSSGVAARVLTLGGAYVF